MRLKAAGRGATRSRTGLSPAVTSALQVRDSAVSGFKSPLGHCVETLLTCRDSAGLVLLRLRWSHGGHNASSASSERSGSLTLRTAAPSARPPRSSCPNGEAGPMGNQGPRRRPRQQPRGEPGRRCHAHRAAADAGRARAAPAVRVRGAVVRQARRPGAPARGSVRRCGQQVHLVVHDQASTTSRTARAGGRVDGSDERLPERGRADASTYGLVVLELREPTEDDLAERIRSLRVTTVVQMPVIRDVRFHATVVHPEPGALQAFDGTSRWEARTAAERSTACCSARPGRRGRRTPSAGRAARRLCQDGKSFTIRWTQHAETRSAAAGGPCAGPPGRGSAPGAGSG